MATDDAIAAKRELRRRLRARRRALEAEERREADALIAEGVLGSAEFAGAKILLSYLGFGHEVATRSVIETALSQGKEVALPRCEAPHLLAWYRVCGLGDLLPSPMGMEEPDPKRSERLVADELSGSLALVPALAFDHAGYRLGYGGGYYDAFLAGFPGVTMGLCREADLIDDLRSLCALEPHDLPVLMVMTEERLLRP